MGALFSGLTRLGPISIIILNKYLDSYIVIDGVKIHGSLEEPVHYPEISWPSATLYTNAPTRQRPRYAHKGI